MNDEYEYDLELGTVSADTRGGVIGIADFENGQQMVTGLADD